MPDFRRLLPKDDLPLAAEVSGVEAGAVGTPFLIRKSSGSKETDMPDSIILKAVADTKLENEAKLTEALKDLDDKGREAGAAIVRIAKGFEDKVPVDVLQAAFKAAGIEMVAKVDDDDKDDEWMAKKLGVTVKQLKDAIAKIKKGEEEEDDVTKALTDEQAERITKSLDAGQRPDLSDVDPTVKAVLERIWKGRQDATEQVKKAAEQIEVLKQGIAVEKRARLEREVLEEVRKDFAGLPGSDEATLVTDLIELRESGLAEDVRKRHEDRLKASAAAVTKSLDQIGGPGPQEPAGPAAELDARAEELRKASPDLTAEQAFLKACEQLPDAYRRYRGQ